MAMAIGITSCMSAESRTVDYPFIGYANTNVLDVARVELTDTATLVKFDVRFRPKYWIQVGYDVVLKADG